MTKHCSRLGLIVGIAALVGVLAGPVAPVQAAALSSTDVGGVSYSTPPSGNFAVGDSVSVTVCFVGTVSGSADRSGLKLNMNNGMQLSTTGTLSNSPAGAGGTPPAGTNNCLVFTKTIAVSDTSVLGLQATGLFIPDTIQIAVGLNSTTGAGGNTVVALGAKGALSASIGVNAKPTVVDFTPSNSASTVKRDAVLALTFNESIRLVATKIIKLRKDVDSDGSFDDRRHGVGVVHDSHLRQCGNWRQYDEQRVSPDLE